MPKGQLIKGAPSQPHEISVDDWNTLRDQMDSVTMSEIDACLNDVDIRTWDGYNSAIMSVTKLVLKHRIHPVIAEHVKELLELMFRGLIVATDKYQPENVTEIQLLQSVDDAVSKAKERSRMLIDSGEIDG